MTNSAIVHNVNKNSKIKQSADRSVMSPLTYDKSNCGHSKHPNIRKSDPCHNAPSCELTM